MEEARPRDGFDTFVEQMYDLCADEEEDLWDEVLLDELYERYCHPLNLNQLTEDQLSDLPFLTPVQIGDILDYAERHRPILSTGELMALSSLDYTTRRLLQLFTYAGPQPTDRPTLHNLLTRGRNDLTLRYDQPFYTRRGFAESSSSTSRYLGSRPYFSARWQFESMNHLEAGFQCEKDPGEKGLDYLSAYAIIRDRGILHTLAIGDYRLSFGHGLVVNTTSGFGKTLFLSSLGRMDRGIRRHSSTIESGYMRGVATTLRLSSDVTLSAFVSHRPVDATLTDDNNAVATLLTDGLHRTNSEVNRRHNLTKTDVGGNLAWQGTRLRLSATAVHTHFSLPLRPRHDTPSTRYRLYNPTGSDFTVFSLSGRYIASAFTLSGEAATTANGGVGLLGMMQTELGTHRLTLVGRYYSKDYASINGKTFSDNQRPQNEAGVWLGWQCPLSRNLTADAYCDLIHFPWPKYGVHLSSYAVDAQAQLTYVPTESHTLHLRFRVTSREHDWRQGDDLQSDLIFFTRNSLRLMHQWEPTTAWRIKSIVSTALLHRADRGAQSGISLSEQVSWQGWQPLHLSLSMTWYHTDDYSARIYSYEPSLLYTYGVSALSGQGLRTSLLAQLRLPHRLDLIAKFSTTLAFDKNTLGSGSNEIPQNHREDLQMQLRWRF